MLVVVAAAAVAAVAVAAVAAVVRSPRLSPRYRRCVCRRREEDGDEEEEHGVARPAEVRRRRHPAEDITRARGGRISWPAARSAA